MCMKLFILFLMTSMISYSALAEDSVLILKQVSGDGKITFVRPEGPPPWSGFWVKDMKQKRLMLMKVLKCNSKICIGMDKEPESKVQLSMGQDYRAEYLDKFARGARTETPTAKTKRRQQAYVGYGGPLGGALNLQYGWMYKDVFTAGVGVSQIFSKTKSVKLSGNTLTATARMEVLPLSKNLSLFFTGQLGIVQGEMTFLATGTNFKKKELTFLVAAAPELAYKMGDISLAVRLGFSKSGLSSKYSDGAVEYSNPYGKLLAYTELGAYWEF
jgi:hypothetical protein